MGNLEPRGGRERRRIFFSHIANYYQALKQAEQRPSELSGPGQNAVTSKPTRGAANQRKGGDDERWAESRETTTSVFSKSAEEDREARRRNGQIVSKRLTAGVAAGGGMGHGPQFASVRRNDPSGRS